MKALLLAVAASLLSVLPEPAPPDLAPPGMNLVRNELVVQWADTLGAVRLVVAPAQGPERRHEIVRGEPFARPRGPFARARLYAVPAAAKELPVETAAWEATGWPSVALPGSAVNAVSSGSPVHRVRAEVVVDAIDASTVHCRVLRTVQFDRDGNEVVASVVLLPALAAVAGVVLLVLFARRRTVESS